MNILLFESNFSKSNILGWISFINIFKNDYNLLILTESLESKKVFNSYFDDIKCISINENINNKSISEEKIKNTYKKYKKSKIFFERLAINNSSNSLFTSNKNNFEEKVSIYIDYIENILIKNNINKVMMCIVESYQSYVYSIIENILYLNKKECLIFQHPILKGFIYDNQLRYSEEIFQNYKKILNESIPPETELKVVEAIDAYKEYLASKSHFNYLYARKSKFINLKNKLKNYINNSINSLKLEKDIILDLNDIKLSKKNYSVLLLNKFNNYRNNKFSPFHSLTENIIRNISISIPFGHILLIKLHPHDTINNIFLRNEISNHYNIKILHPDISLNQILPLVNLVFSQSTTSALESLMYYKHLVMFGANLQFFGKNFDFVNRVTDYEKLPELVDTLLNTKVDKKKIHNFFISLFSFSYSRDQSDDNLWSNFKLHANIKDIYIKAAITLKNKLEKN